jgi:RNA polymerase sigma-70 factor (ECF subfamily)
VAAPTSTFGLIELARAGDQGAFERLFRKYERRLAALVQVRLGPELRAEVEPDDILQETFVRAFGALARFTYRGPGSFWGWLASVARSVLADTARYRGRERRAGERVPLGPGHEPVDTATPSRMLRHREAVGELMAKLDALPADDREVIVLAKIEGLTTAEMAERLGKTREQVALLLHRALKRFRGRV